MKDLRNSFICLLIFIMNNNTYSQGVNILTSGTKTSIRGLSVVNKNIIWASGSNGMVARSVDGGKIFTWQQVAHFEKKDFRDIEAFDSNVAIIMCIAEPAFVLKTINGGKDWNTVFTDSSKGMFLDAMYFADTKNGIVIGDPLNNKPFIASTDDGGDTWTQNYNTPTLFEGEAFFASSGSNIALKWNKQDKKNDSYFVSGGKKSNLYINYKKYELPIVQGFESTGANSIAIFKNNIIVVGGDFAKDSIANNNCVLFNAKTKQFSVPKSSPFGYRSSVVFLDKNKAVSCGLNGVDITYDKGFNWASISKEGFHIVAKAKKGKAIFLAGSRGRIARLDISKN